MADFEPCPLCNSTRIRGGHVRDGRLVGCLDCGCTVTAYNPNAAEEAKEKWNRRDHQQPDTPAVAEIEALRARIKEMEEALKPFADAAYFYDPPTNDDLKTAWGCNFTIGALRDARSARLGQEGGLDPA